MGVGSAGLGEGDVFDFWRVRLLEPRCDLMIHA